MPIDTLSIRVVLPTARDLHELLQEQILRSETAMAAYARSLLAERLVERKGQRSTSRCIDGTNLSLQAMKEFQVSLYQALVLLLFNKHTDLSYKDIQEHTKIGECSIRSSPTHLILACAIVDKAELDRTMLSLACGKVRLLNKKPLVNTEALSRCLDNPTLRRS